MSKLMNRIASSGKTGGGVSRRGFIIGATSAGATLAFVPSALLASKPAAAIEAKLFEPTVWYAIDLDGQIYVNITKAEMGQHVGTALARIVADELEADWSQVNLKHVDTDPRFGDFVTGGSWSVSTSFDLLSRAGAAGRVALIEAGAKMLGVPEGNCRAKASKVICGSRSVSYAEIVNSGMLERSFTPEDLAKLPLKKPEERSLIGQDTQALDIPAKTSGTAVYGIDASYEGMVYAKPIMPPTRYGSSVKAVDDSGAKGVKGYVQTLVLDDPTNTVPGWALVIADSFHAAQRAQRLIKVDWQAGPTAGVSESDILVRGEELIDSGAGAIVVDDEHVEHAFAAASDELQASYTTSTVLHFQLEPVNAVALQKDGRWELHTGNQWQSLIMPTYAQALDAASHSN